MLESLDAMSELISVVDIETHELLYMNTSGKKQFNLGALDGLKCHRVMQGREFPCDFCTMPYLSEDSYYNWEITNPITGRHYMLKDKLIKWKGRQARLEIAFDSTEKQYLLETKNLRR